MKLNVLTCYAMQSILYMAKNKRVVPSSELSEKLHISQRYVFQIAAKLRDCGFIITHQGVNGGFALKKEASEISVYDVIMAMEGDMNIPKCIIASPGCGGEPCKNSSLLDTLCHMRDYLDTYLRSITFESLAEMDISGHLPDILRLVETHIDEMKGINYPR